MRVVAGEQARISRELYASIARYRHKVFVEQLGWQLQQAREGHELDQFDRPDTVYVVVQDDADAILGCARLLPTTSPYLLSEVFPHLLNGLPPPCSPEVWELSRFSAVDFIGTATAPMRRLCSPVGTQLLHASIACAASHGARRILTLSPLGVERLLRAAGVNAHRAGPPMLVDGKATFACLIDVDSAVPAEARVEGVAVEGA